MIRALAVSDKKSAMVFAHTPSLLADTYLYDDPRLSSAHHHYPLPNVLGLSTLRIFRSDPVPLVSFQRSTN